MKPGDKVWVFDNEKVLKVEYGEFLGRGFLFAPKRYSKVIIGWDANIKPYFPTREALCEHYRKIFE